MAEKALFLASRYVQAATLAASSAMPLLPVTYLQKQEPDKVWRATGCTAEWITLDLGTARACNGAGFVGVNWTAAATVRIRANSVADMTAAPLDTGSVSPWPATGKPTDEDWPIFACLVRWVNSTAYRYWRIDIVDAANPDGYVELGRPYLANYFQPVFNVDINIGVGLDSPDQRTRTPAGKTFTDGRGPPSRRFVLPISAVNERDLWDSLFDLQRLCGLAVDFFFSLDPSATTDFHRYSMQALFADGAQFDSQPFWDATGQVWRTSLTLLEQT